MLLFRFPLSAKRAILNPPFFSRGKVFLSLLLIIDETTNVRFGILGPQESKGGAAWTCF